MQRKQLLYTHLVKVYFVILWVEVFHLQVLCEPHLCLVPEVVRRGIRTLGNVVKLHFQCG